LCYAHDHGNEEHLLHLYLWTMNPNYELQYVESIQSYTQSE